MSMNKHKKEKQVVIKSAESCGVEKHWMSAGKKNIFSHFYFPSCEKPISSQFDWLVIEVSYAQRTLLWVGWVLWNSF